MTVRRWVLVAAVAFVLLALRIEARDAALSLTDVGSQVVLSESVRPSMAQLGIMILTMTGGLALLVHFLKAECSIAPGSWPAPGKNRVRRSSSPASSPDGAGQPGL